MTSNVSKVHVHPCVQASQFALFTDKSGHLGASLQALRPAFPISGKNVMIHAGAGGVGSFAIQIAKALGASVTTTCSASNLDFVTHELGADCALDYKKEVGQ